MSKNMLSYFSKIPKQTELLKNDEVLELKKALESIDVNSNSSVHETDSASILRVIELSLKYSTLVATVTANNENKYKRDLAIQILETVNRNYLNSFDRSKVVQLLNAEFCEKLLKLFETPSNELNALQLVQLLLTLLGVVLHHNIAVINPLLQIMEYAFKHVNNDVKACGYDSWRHLINNFALDRDFFFKPKKFNLLLMPLINKTKSYKSENVCKSKALAWLCLIENIGSKLPSYLTNVLIPFFNYCFAINGADGVCNEAETLGSQNENLKAFLQSRRSVGGQAVTASPSAGQNGHTECLLRIGMEMYVSFICNGDKENVPEDIAKSMKHVSLNRDYCIEETLNDTWNWIILLKYFHNVFVSNCHTLEGETICFVWLKLLSLFEKNQQDKLKDEKKTAPFKLNLDDEQELIEYFLLNSIETVHTNVTAPTSSAKKTNKVNEALETRKHMQKILYEISRSVLKYLSEKAEYCGLLKTEKVLHEIEANFKDFCEILLLQSDNSSFLQNLEQVLRAIENSNTLQNENLYQLWSFLQSKLNDYLKQLNKSQEQSSAVIDFNPVYAFLAFPFKNFLNLKLEQADFKTFTSQLQTIAKSFSSVCAAKTAASPKMANTYFNSIMKHFYEKFIVEQTNNLQKKLNLEDLKANLMKYLQEYSQLIQFVAYLFNNLFHFSVNETESDAPSVNSNIDFKLKLFTKQTSDPLNEKNVSYLCKILTHLLDCYVSLTQINDAATDAQQQEQHYQMSAQTFLITFMDIVMKLAQNFTQNSQEVDYILCELASIVCKLFDLHYNLKTLTKSNQATNELERELILRYFNQTFINSKKFNDHFEHLFNELNSLLQHKHILSSYEFDTSKRLAKYEPIVYSLFKFANLKTQLRHKIVNVWNVTFGKCVHEPLCYPKRLEKCFHELNNDSSIILLNTTATLTNNTDKDKKLAISLPGFHNCENIMVNNMAQSPPPPSMAPEKNKFLNGSNKENSPLILNDTSMSASLSSSVPIVQLIHNNSKKRELELILTDDDTGDSVDLKKAQLTSPSTNTNRIVNFVFSPAAAAGNSALKSYQQKSSPFANNQNVLSSNQNSATKRKLELQNLIDQQPDKDFIKISDKQSKSTLVGNSATSNFKAPLTEHQKEMKKAKQFLPSEIHNVCIELTSSMHDPNQSMSCTLDFDELPPMNKPVVVVEQEPKEEKEEVIPDSIDDTVTEIPATQTSEESEVGSSLAHDWLRNSKRLKIEPAQSPKDGSKLQFYSKIKPNKSIEVISLSESEETPSSSFETTEKLLEVVQEASQGEEIKRMDMSIEALDEKDLVEDDPQSSQRKSKRIKSKGAKTMQVLLEKVDVDEVESKTAATVEAEPAPVADEIKASEEPVVEKKEAVPAVKRRGRRPNTITILPSQVKEAEALIMNKIEEMPVNSQESTTSESQSTDDVAPTTRRRGRIPRRQSIDSISTKEKDEEQLSNSQMSLLKPILDKNSKITKTKGKTMKSKLQTVVEKLQESGSKISEVNAAELDENKADEASNPLSDICKMGTTSEKRRSSRISSKRSSISYTDNDVRIDDPFPSSEEEQSKDGAEVKKPEVTEEKPVEEPKVVEMPAENAPTTPKPLETIQETETEKPSSEKEAVSVVEDKQSTIEETMTTITAIQFAKSLGTPTASILKKRRSMNYNLNDLSSNDNNSPSRRRVSFCESVQIEEIEPNNNAKSIFRTTPKVSAINKAKLVISPYLNKSPTSTASPSAAATNTLAALSEAASTTNAQKLASIQSKFNSLSSQINPQQAPASTAPSSSSSSIQAPSTSVPSSPANSLINLISLNKQNFLSQRSTIIQQQMLQNQQHKTETCSPLSSSSSTIIATSTTTTVVTTPVVDSSQASDASTSEPQHNTDTDSIYPALKDCQMSLDKIIHELTSPMWSNGIIQLLKSKNVLTIGDLCQLKAKEINELPFKTPKIENFMKIIQKFHASQQTASATKAPEPTPVEDEEATTTSTTKSTSKQTTPMGSLEEEMAKLEEADCLDTSIECESLNALNETKEDCSMRMIEDESSSNNENKPPMTAPLSLENIIKAVNESITSNSVPTSELESKMGHLNTSDLIQLMNHINSVNLKIAQVNNLVLEKLKSK